MIRVMQLLAALLFAAPAIGVQFGNADLPADSRWYVHLNLDNMRTSPLGSRWFEESIGEAFADIQQELGVDLDEDIGAITVFGPELPPSSPAIILHGTLSAATRASLLAAMEGAGSYTEHEYAGMVYYAVDDLGRDRDPDHRRDWDDLLLVAIGPAQTMVTPSEAAIHRFLEGGGHSARADAADPAAMIVLQADRAIAQGGLDASGARAGGHWESSILNNVKGVAGVIADENDGLRVRVEIEATSEETAAYVHNVLQGLASLKALDAADEPEVAEALKALRVTTAGRRVELNAILSPQLVAELIE